jgi:hypothetical protein
MRSMRSKRERTVVGGPQGVRCWSNGLGLVAQRSSVSRRGEERESRRGDTFVSLTRFQQTFYELFSRISCKTSS